MKKIFVLAVSCVIFSYLVLNVGVVYALENREINFYYGDKIFSYSINQNKKTSDIFDQHYTINKYNRNSSHEDRVYLLHTMLDLGFDNSIIVQYLFPNINNTISKIEKNINLNAKDATLKINTNTNKVFYIEKEQIGIKLDRDKLYQNLITTYLNSQSLDISIPVQKLYPTVTSKDLEKFTHLRSDFSTDISRSSEDRKHNIKNSLASLNRVEISPGEIFSFNKCVGKRTAENGYREAKIIVNNEFVEGIGGGVCQVSSTLYNTALLSGLEIIEANKHSKQVQYVKYGFDAMVNFGSSDLKFRNNTQEKVTIITNYSNNSIRIRIFGEDLNNVSYKLTNEISNIQSPTEEIQYDEDQKYLDKVTYTDEFFYLKQASTGMDVNSYRKKYLNGELVGTELLRTDKYKVQNAIKVYGTKQRETIPSD